MLPTETEKFLAKFIRAGDGIELASGKIWPAHSEVSERYGTSYYGGVVPVVTELFIVPIHTYGIKGVWRNGVCVWRLGETVVQKALF